MCNLVFRVLAKNGIWKAGKGKYAKNWLRVMELRGITAGPLLSGRMQHLPEPVKCCVF